MVKLFCFSRLSNVRSKLHCSSNDKEIQNTKSKGDAGKGPSPWLQPPGKHLGAVVPKSVSTDRMAATVGDVFPQIDIIHTEVGRYILVKVNFRFQYTYSLLLHNIQHILVSERGFCLLLDQYPSEL